jgi:serine/threonine protein kinase
VILVNLTCGRNPWKQASYEDSTYRAYTRSQDFLKTILPLTDELNDILGRIFTRNPDQRITLAELRTKILACPQFTIPAMPATNIESPQDSLEYVECEDAIVEDYDYESPLSPATSSDDGSTCSSDDGSLASSVSTIDDLDDEFLQEQQQDMSPQDYPSPHPHAFEPEEVQTAFYPTQEYVPQHYAGPVPLSIPVQVPVASLPIPVPMPEPMPIQVPAQVPVQLANCAPKGYFLNWWDIVKYVQHAPAIHPHVPFHHQVPFPAIQGCY